MDLDTIRQICLAHKGTTEEVQWGEHLLFKVGGKMFCITNMTNPGDTAFKVENDEFEALCDSDIFISEPHLARAKWVKVIRPEAIRIQEWKSRIETSYDLVFRKLTKKMQGEIQGG